MPAGNIFSLFKLCSEVYASDGMKTAFAKPEAVFSTAEAETETVPPRPVIKHNTPILLWRV